jgi:hypothetical protein
MFLYFYVLDRALYHDELVPVLAAAYRMRTFKPCFDLCHGLLARNASIPQDAVVRAVLAGLPFERVFWQALVGECLIHGAWDIPRLQTAPEGFCTLLAPDHVDVQRDRFAPIQQVHFGARDLTFGGGYYRPEHAGINKVDDVRRLAEYLAGIDPKQWHGPDAEELADLRDWWPDLVGLYQSARDSNRIIVCEIV